MSEPEVIRSDASDQIAMLHHAVGLDPAEYQRSDVAHLAGVAHERSVKWWRAMGFPEVPENVYAFADIDVEMVRRLAALTGAGLVDEESTQRLARLLGASFSRIAEAQMAIVEQLAVAVPETGPRRRAPTAPRP